MRLASAFRLRRDKGYPPDVRPFHEAASPGAAGSELVSWSAGSQSRGRPFRWHRIFACQPCAVCLVWAHPLVGSVSAVSARSARAYSRVGTSSGPTVARRSPIVNTPEGLTVPGDGHRAKPIVPVGRAVSARLPKSDRRDPCHRWRRRRRANSRGRVPEGYGRLKYGLANGSCAEGAPGGGKWAGSKSH
jgi:hypothetical protein